MEEFSGALERFSLVCSRLQNDPSVKNLEELYEVLNQCGPGAIQGFHEFVTIPIDSILQNKNHPEIIKLKALNCLEYILKNVKLELWSLFSELFLQLLMLASGIQGKIVVAPLSEEMKLAVTVCMKHLITCSNKKVIKEMFDSNFRLPLGHAVYLLLKLAEDEKCRAVQASAMEVILSFLQAAEKYDLCIEAGDRFASFLPGLCTSLVKILLGDQKQGHLVLVTALRLLQACITIVMGDTYLEIVNKLQEQQQKTDVASDQPAAAVNVETLCEGRSLPVPVVSRTEDWVKDASRKLHYLIMKTVTLVKHDNWQVTLALVEWTKGLLVNCTKSLKTAMPMFLVLLLTKSMHPYEVVRTKSCETLQEFSQICMQKTQKSLLDILEGELYCYVSMLPRAIRSTGDEDKANTLNLLCGYISCLGSSFNRFLCSPPHKERLIHSLLVLAEFNCSDVYLLEERAVSVGALSSPESSSSAIQWPKKSFKHFSSQSVQQGLVQICHLIGYCCDPMLLADILLEKMKESAIMRKQAIFLLNEVIVGVSGTTVRDTYCWKYLTQIARCEGEDQNQIKTLSDELLSYVLDEYLHPDVWDTTGSTSFSGSSIESLMESFSMLNLSNSPKKQPGSVEDQNSSILQKCLLLEGIAKLAQVKGPSFRTSLVRVICPVLERAGSQCAVVSHTAKLTLQSLVTSCEYNSIPDLISNNADYLVSAVSVKIRHFAQNPDAPFVLQAALQLCDAEVVPLLADAVNEVFRALDANGTDKAMPFMKALHSVVSAIHKFHSANTDQSRKDYTYMNGNESSNANAQEQMNKRVKALQEFFLEYHHNKVIAEDLALSEESVETEPYVEDCNKACEEDVKPDLPCHVQVVKQILERCIHVLSSEDPWMRLLVLDIIGLGALALRNYESELLPMAHNLWSPFVQRFNDLEFVVVKKAFETLVKMADACGDFIRRRTLTDVWPKLASFLEKQCSLSYGKDNSAYKFTIASKFQSALLLELGNLATKLQICDREISLLVSACIPYLSSHQPKALQEAAVKFLCQMSLLDADIVWLLLVDTYNSSPSTPPHACFRPVLLGDTAKTEFAHNVNRLLEYIS